mmetsp:Transcript_29332/g.59458  ORF Transcript_29332/g.59458 Transcript_29332/m.59458 type:complete len:428 (+) Transcript_29332:139-1422(+)
MLCYHLLPLLSFFLTCNVYPLYRKKIKPKWHRLLLASGAFALLFAVEMVYYYIHFRFSPDDDGDNGSSSTAGNGDDDSAGEGQQQTNPYVLIMAVDALVVFVLMLFPLAGPLHRSLGYLHCGDGGNGGDGDGLDVDPLVLQTRLDTLIQDRGTIASVNMFLCCVALYSIGELLYFLPRFGFGGIMTIVYVVSVFLSITTFYGAMLVIMLTMRTILTRLIRIEESVDECLIRSNPTSSSNNYNAICPGDDGSTAQLVGSSSSSYSSGGDVKDQIATWTESYRSIRQDVHNISQSFGVIMLAGLFLFTLDTTSMIALLWESLGRTMAPRDVIGLLLSFTSNAAMITAALYSTAFVVTACVHHIGPKIVILAARHEDMRQLPSVAAMFLHAPVRIHVGNFEVSPEYANGVAIWFLGLFLVVFGIKIPGAE